MEPDKKSDLDKKWNLLIKYDSDARAAVQKLQKYGPEAVDKLKEVYNIIGNKTQFFFIADQIAADYRKDAATHTANEAPPHEHSKDNAAEDADRERKQSISIYGVAAILSSVLSLFILPIIFAPVALLLGAMALFKNEKHRAALVVIAIIVSAVALFNFFKLELQSGIM